MWSTNAEVCWMEVCCPIGSGFVLNRCCCWWWTEEVHRQSSNSRGAIIEYIDCVASGRVGSELFEWSVVVVVVVGKDNISKRRSLGVNLR